METEWDIDIKRLEEMVAERICEILPKCVEVLGDNPSEDDITKNLVNRFPDDHVIRELFSSWQEQFEPPSIDEKGAYYSKGRVDFALFRDKRRKKYLGFETKKLNVSFPSGKKSLIKEYINEGVVRFVNEKYSEDFPIGCMLGIVMDGEVTITKENIFRNFDNNSSFIGLVKGPFSLESIGSTERFESTHERNISLSKICIYHTLLPYEVS